MILKPVNTLNLLLTGAVSAVLMTAIPADAAHRRQPPEKTIEIGDLDLDREHGARAALRRIENAARDVCVGAHPSRELGERMEERKCVETTTARTIRQLNAPLVTAYYNRREKEKRLAVRNGQKANQ